jgi:hypothetical protein
MNTPEPLWRGVSKGHDDGFGTSIGYPRHSFAAELRAIENWIWRKQLEHCLPDTRELLALLRAEADRAEAGE